MTLNGVTAFILCYFTEFDSFVSRSRITVVVCRISSSTFGQNWLTLQRGLSAIIELLFYLDPHDNDSGPWPWSLKQPLWTRKYVVSLFSVAFGIGCPPQSSQCLYHWPSWRVLSDCQARLRQRYDIISLAPRFSTIWACESKRRPKYILVNFEILPYLTLILLSGCFVGKR